MKTYDAVPYFGKVCRKHPHLKGRRGATHHRCLECAREASRAAYGERFSPSVVYTSICAKHPELKGRRLVRSRRCVQCNRDLVSAYRKTRRAAAKAARQSPP